MSKLDQINQTRFKSFTFDARVDVRSMAIITMFFRKNKVPALSRAAVGRLAIEWFSEIIVNQNPELEITDPVEALEVLATCGITPIARSKQPLMKHLAAASLNIATGPDPDKLLTKQGPKAVDSNSQIVRAVQARMNQTDEEQIAVEKSEFSKRMEDN